MSDWPTDDHITNVAHNGECDAPTYRYVELLWRLNPVGRYAFYFHKGVWRESQSTTNENVVAGGILQ